MTTQQTTFRDLCHRSAVVLFLVAALLATLLRATESPADAQVVSTTTPGAVFHPGDPKFNSTQAQHDAVGALELDVVRRLAAYHGVADDDRIRSFARGEIRANLYLRFTEVIQKAAVQRTPDEALVYEYLRTMVQGYRFSVAAAAKAEYDKWSSDKCGYDPPSPFTYSPPNCDPSNPNIFNPEPDPPTFEEFQSYGTAKVLHQLTDPNNGKLSQAAAEGIALAAGTAGAAIGAGVGAAVGAIPAVAKGFVALIGSNALVGVGGGLTGTAMAGMAAIFATIILAVVILVIGSIQLFNEGQLPIKLDQAKEAARTATPDLLGMVSSSDGAQSFFAMFMDRTLPDAAGNVVVPGLADAGLTAWKTRTEGQSTFGDADTVAVPGAVLHTNRVQTVGLRDGWFVVQQPDGSRRYETFIDYLGWDGQRWRSTVLADGRFLHQQLRNGLPSMDCVADGAPIADPVGHVSTNDDSTCFVRDEIRFADVHWGSNGEPDSITWRAIKRNRPATQPTITVGDNNRENENVTFTASSTDPEGDPITYRWTATLPCPPLTIGNCAIFGLPTVTKTGPSVQFNFPQDGVYPVTVTATDNKSGIARTTTQNVTIVNQAATVTVTNRSNRTIDEGDSITVAGTIDDPGRYDVVTVVVEWGDGTTSQKSFSPHVCPSIARPCPNPERDGDEPFSFTHTYADDPETLFDPSFPSSYRVRVDVRDDGGSLDGIAGGPFFARVNNLPPFADMGLPGDTTEGGQLTFAGTVVDPGADDVNVKFEWGDGSADTTVLVPKVGDRTFSIDHTFADNPTAPATSYPLKITLTDDDGGSLAGSGSVGVVNTDPTVAINDVVNAADASVLPDKAFVGQPLTAKLSFADAGTLDAPTASFDWGDGSALETFGGAPVGTTKTPTHTYTSAGARTLEALVTDKDGATGQASRSLTVVKAGTTTALVSSANPSAAGQDVTFTATVTAEPGWGAAPTGTVEFYDGTTKLGARTLDTDGKATLTTGSLAGGGGGSHTITAVYLDNRVLGGSTSPSLTQTVVADTRTGLTSSANPSMSGQALTFTARVTSVAPGAGTPTGTVQFKDGATNLGTPKTLVNGSATFQTSSLSVSPSHAITAVYSGATTFNTSTSPTLTQVVRMRATSTALASSLDPTVFGQAVTFTARVTAVAPDTGVPTGTVQFMDGATNLGTPRALVNGVATLQTSALVSSDHVLTAVYSGATGFDGSTSPPLTQVVQKAGTRTLLTSSVNPSVFGQPVTFTASVTPVAPGTGTPTGTVQFQDSGVDLGGPVPLVNGVATLQTSALPVGNLLSVTGGHPITAVYTGAVSFHGSSSSVVSQVVRKAYSRTSLASSANPSVYGETIVFTAQVTPVAPGAGAPTGTVQFKDNGVNLGSPVPLVNGVATLSRSSMAVTGGRSIIAVYSGDPSFNGSTSPTVTQAVKITTTTALTSSPNPSVFGQTIAFTARVIPVAPGTGTPTGAVQFQNNGVNLGSPVSLVNGVATLRTSALSVGGGHGITAVYAGAPTFHPSTSPALTQVVQ